jgi:hypothetical protein
MSDQHPTPPVPAHSQYGPPAPEPRKKKNFFLRHKVLTTLLALVVFVIVIVIATSSGGGSNGTTASGSAGAHATNKAAGAKKADKPAKKAVAKAPGIGDPVRDGKFQFTVTKVDKPVKKVGNSILGDTAQGEFIKVHITVKNIGNESQMFDDSAQELHDTKGRQFDADTSADIDIDNSNSFLEDINPGNSVKGVVVFDVPKGAKISSIELHDSIFSDGTSVSLS